MRVYGPLNSGAGTGGAGVATANTSSATRLVGRVIAIYVKYNDTPPATTDVTVKTLGTSPSAPTQNLLVLTDANTSGWFYPRVQVNATTGSAIAATYDKLAIYDNINVAIAQANDADSVDVWVMLEEI